jgi:hypothetical protein
MAMRIGFTGWGLPNWLLAGILLCGNLFGQESDESIRAGAYAQDITPGKWPISVNGNMSDLQATAAHDPLHARCIVLKNKETSLAIVVCDSCMIPREVMDRAKTQASTSTGIPASNILISATHSHSCPTATPVFQSEPDAEYLELLVERIAQGIERANDQLEPARVGSGSIEQRSLLFNRRWYIREFEIATNTVENPFGVKSDRVITNPGYNNPNVSRSMGLIDPELSFLSVQSRSGRPIALLANYSLHYIGGVPSDLVSADYFGEFAQRVARKLNAVDVQPPFVGIMSNGTSGDVNNVDFRQTSPAKREPFEQISFVAELLAQEVAKACEKIEYVDAAPLKVRQAEIVVGVRKPVEEEVIVAEKKLAELGDGPLKDLNSIYTRETVLLGRYPTSVKIKLQAIRIGSLAIAACPCETFTETGLALKKTNKLKKMFTISLANGYNGYLPPPDQFLLGGYETWRARSSCLTSDSEPKIQSTLKRLLREVSQ